MESGSVLLAIMLALTAVSPATAFAAGEQHDGDGQIEAVGKPGSEEPVKEAGRVEEKADAPAGGHVLNYEELFGCKPMEGREGHDHMKEKRQIP